MKAISTDQFRSLMEGALAEHRASLGDEIHQAIVRGMCDAFRDGMDNAARICEEPLDTVRLRIGEFPRQSEIDIRAALDDRAEAIREAAKR